VTDFYQTQEWKLLKQKVLHKYGLKCMKCGKTPKSDVLIAVDHVKPRSEYKSLALKFSNMQVLCQPCNSAKGTKIEDYRVNKLANAFIWFLRISLAVLLIGLLSTHPSAKDLIVELTGLTTVDACEKSVNPSN